MLLSIPKTLQWQVSVLSLGKLHLQTSLAQCTGILEQVREDFLFL